MAIMNTPAPAPESTPASRPAGRLVAWLLIALGAAAGLLVGLLWLGLWWFGGSGTPDPSLQREAWLALLVGVTASGVVTALGVRRLDAQPWSRAFGRGLLIGGVPALLVVLWALARNSQ